MALFPLLKKDGFIIYFYLQNVNRNFSQKFYAICKQSKTDVSVIFDFLASVELKEKQETLRTAAEWINKTILYF
jgi:hypothetical protein